MYSFLPAIYRFQEILLNSIKDETKKSVIIGHPKKEDRKKKCHSLFRSNPSVILYKVSDMLV